MINDIKNNEHGEPDIVKPRKIPTFIFWLNAILSAICIFVGYLAADHYIRSGKEYNDGYVFIITAVFMVSFAILYNHYLYLQSR